MSSAAGRIFAPRAPATLGTVRALAVVHQADAGPGVFADSLRDAGAELDTWWPERGSPARDPSDYDAVIVLGGAVHPDQDATRPWLAAEKAVLAELVQAGIPVLGVCLGAQLLAIATGGHTRRASLPEIGFTPVELTGDAATDPLLGALPARFDAVEWHSYECRPPPGAIALAHSAVCLQAYRIGSAAWGIQFHAEVTQTDLEKWIDGYRSDPDAVRIGVDPVALRAEGRELITDWNELGRGLCDRFLAFAGDRRR